MGSLLTIVLVFISDVRFFFASFVMIACLFRRLQILFGAGPQIVTLWSVIGSTAIVVAFGILTYDMSVKDSEA